jgi:hypothetical protein
LQNLQIFGLALRKKAQYVVVIYDWTLMHISTNEAFELHSIGQ